MTVTNRYLTEAILILMLLSFTALAVAQDAVSESPIQLTCTLADQIRAQNSGRSVGDCEVSGNVIELHEDIVLTEPLPKITAPIHIVGNGHTLSGDGKFRLFEVDGAFLAIYNLQLVEGYAKFFGSAILVENAGHLELHDSVIRNCWTASYGAVYIDLGTLSVYNSTFESNEADYGAAIYSSISTTYISNSRFEHNLASSGGAIFLSSGNGFIKNSDFLKNIARGSGGAIYRRHGAMQIVNSEFSDNSAFNGGAIYATGQRDLLSIDDSSFVGNSVNWHGGAIYADTVSVYISDSSSYRNTAVNAGGGIFAYRTALFISFSSLKRNESKEGAALYAVGGNATILATAIADKISTEGGEQLTFEETEVRYLDIRDD